MGKRGIQVLGIACWHVRVLEHNARRVVHAQVQQVWPQIVELDRPARVTSRKMGILLRGEPAGRGAIQERAMSVLMMEATAARRKRGQLPTQSCWGEGDPQVRKCGGARTRIWLISANVLHKEVMREPYKELERLHRRETQKMKGMATWGTSKSGARVTRAQTNCKRYGKALMRTTPEKRKTACSSVKEIEGHYDGPSTWDYSSGNPATYSKSTMDRVGHPHC